MNSKLVIIVTVTVIVFLFLSIGLVTCGQIDFDGPPLPEALIQETGEGLKSVRFSSLPSVIELREMQYQVIEGQTNPSLLEFLDGDMQLLIPPPAGGCVVVKVDLVNWSSQPFKSGFYVTPRQTVTTNLRVCAK